MKRVQLILWQAVCVLTLVGAFPAAASRSVSPVFEAGLFISRTASPLAPGSTRIRIAGPVAERVQASSGRTFCALRPVAAAVRDPAAQTSTTHVLWPLLTSKRWGNDRSWNSALLIWGRDADVQSATSQWSLIAFPVLAMGRTAEGTNYGAVFPLGGHLEEFAGWDEIDFVMFPLYSHSRQGDLNTWNLFFPIISWTRAKDEARFRVFPLYGQAREPGIRRRFILWPLWNEAHYRAPQHEGYSFMLFPLFGRVNLDNQQSWMALPPLFRYTRAGDKREIMAPWPIVQIKRGGEDELTYVWPLWGVRNRPHFEKRFILWPLGAYERVERPPVTLTRRWFVPFYYHERQVEAGSGKDSPTVIERHVRIWPLATYQRSQDAMQFHMLELWPAASVDAVERLYAPFWTLYSHERKGDASVDELLWGLFRRTRMKGEVNTSVFPLVSWGGTTDNTEKRWDVLKGLIRYEREAGVRRWRFLYFMRFE